MVDRQNCNSNKMNCITCSRVVIIIRIVHTVHILSFSIMYQSASSAAGNGANQSINSSLTAGSKVEPELGTRVRRPSSELVPSTDGCLHVSCHKLHCVALSLNASPCHIDNDDKALRTLPIK